MRPCGLEDERGWLCAMASGHRGFHVMQEPRRYWAYWSRPEAQETHYNRRERAWGPVPVSVANYRAREGVESGRG